MFTKKLLPAMLISLVALAGCRSDDPKPTSAQDFECICGTPEGAVNSCLHRDCVSGEGNDDNPDCACGNLSIDK